MLDQLIRLWKHNTPFKLAVIIIAVGVLIIVSKLSSKPHGTGSPQSTGKNSNPAYLTGKGVIRKTIPKVPPSVKGNIQIEQYGMAHNQGLQQASSQTYVSGVAYLELFAENRPAIPRSTATVKTLWKKDLSMSSRSFIIPGKEKFFPTSVICRISFYYAVYEPGSYTFIVRTGSWMRFLVEGMPVLEGKGKNMGDAELLEAGLYAMSFEYFSPKGRCNDFDIYIKSPSDLEPKLVTANKLLLPK